MGMCGWGCVDGDVWMGMCGWGCVDGDVWMGMCGWEVTYIGDSNETAENHGRYPGDVFRT
jgi:hypothetical protein